MEDRLACTEHFKSVYGDGTQVVITLGDQLSTRETVTEKDVTFVVRRDRAGVWTGTEVHVEGVEVAYVDVTFYLGVAPVVETEWVMYSANLRDHVWAAADAINFRRKQAISKEREDAKRKAEEQATKEEAFRAKWEVEDVRTDD